MRALLTLLFLLLSLAGAARIEIITDPNDATSRLEIRNVTLPDGSTAELYIMQASPVRVRIDNNELIAEYIEFDFSAGVVRIVGPGVYISPEESIDGEDFIINLNDESLRVQNVLIFTTQLDVVGLDASRVPGQINVIDAAFSPCSRCNQEVEDYGFRASRLQLYPGDRLVAYEVSVLIRGVQVFYLPILVVPLGPADRQPRLTIRQGTATARAEVAIDWPYTAGANAFGVTSLRYYADVVPGEGNFFTENLLGGGVRTSYIGGGNDHTFYTDEGRGRITFFYVPSFIDTRVPGGRTRDEITYRVAYNTLENLGLDEISLLIERVDSRRQRITEYSLGLGARDFGLIIRFFTQGFIDHDPEDDINSPSYAARNVPERTITQITILPDGGAGPGGSFGFAPSPTTFTVGPFSLSDLLLDIGVFEDIANPANRSAVVDARAGRITAGRLLEQHYLRLVPLNPWEGLTITGETRFSGRYYTTMERLIDWNSRLDLRQDFGTVGNATVGFTRNTTEGETPFRFDYLPPRSRTDLRAALTLTPLPWLSLSTGGTYVFLDTRNPREVGLGPINTTLTLFNNVRWISLVARNTYTPARAGQPADAGELGLELTLTSPDPLFIGSINLRQIIDLQVTEDRTTGVARNTTSTAVRVEVGYRPYIRLDASTAYRIDPPPAARPEDPRAFWDPLELGVTLGTLEQADEIPGLRLSYVRDLNLGQMRALGLQATARYDVIEVALEQRLDFIARTVAVGRYTVLWRGVASFEASGFALIPPQWFGLELNPERSETRVFNLRDASRAQAQEQWRLTYRAVHDQRGRVDTRLEAFANIDDTDLGGIRFRVNFFTDLRLADDLLPITYLSRVNLELLSDFYGVVALQGRLGYVANFNQAANEFTSQNLTFTDFGITVRATEELYLAAIFNDTWNFTGRNPQQSPFNLQPTLYVVWDRCCWALYGSWDTSSGAITISLGAPGGNQGFVQEINPGLTLPGRGVVRAP